MFQGVGWGWGLLQESKVPLAQVQAGIVSLNAQITAGQSLLGAEREKVLILGTTQHR